MANHARPSRRMLVIAYIFPPLFSVGGSIRVVKFLKYLPQHNWHGWVLTVDDRQEYEHLKRVGSDELLADLPADLPIHRTGAGEPPGTLIEKGRAAREKSRVAKLIVNSLRVLRKWGQRWLLIPDEKILWLPFAVRAGRRVVKANQLDVIFVTVPPFSSSVIGVLLKRLTGRPLVIDYRDDWLDTVYYWNLPWLVRMVHRWLERMVVNVADRVILVTPDSMAAFRERYPQQPHTKFVYIPNGADLEDFPVVKHVPQRDRPFTIVHAGKLAWTATGDYIRDPRPVFEALASIRRRYPMIGDQLRMVFTGTLEPAFKAHITKLGLEDIVEETGYLPQDAYLERLRTSDLLLTINYDQYATLIPGKIYEYWAVGGPPILLLSQPGAAQDLIARHELGISLLPDDEQGIEEVLLNYYHCRAAGKQVRISRDGIGAYDRATLAQQLAHTLDDVVRE
jgi:glycosyltransferase involved in cell wall biosynthesis